MTDPGFTTQHEPVYWPISSSARGMDNPKCLLVTRSQN